MFVEERNVALALDEQIADGAQILAYLRILIAHQAFYMLFLTLVVEALSC